MFPAAVQPGDGRFQLTQDEFEGQRFNRRIDPGQFLPDCIALGFTDRELAVGDAFGRQSQQGGDVEPGCGGC